MSNIGRPKGNNNKEYVYTLRMDEHTKIGWRHIVDC